jgi:hypothetical protein
MVLWGIAGVALVVAAIWTFIIITTLVDFPKLPLFDRLEPPAPERWPRLSVIIAACNEAETIEPALRTLLAQDYPDLEIIAVDDRSTDATGEVLDRLARDDTRLVVRHVRALPDGWLGKLNAMDQGARAASGELLLFTDADVHFAQGSLRTAVAYALQRNFDHLTIVPRTLSSSFWLDVMINATGTMLLWKLRVADVQPSDPRSGIGVGAFNLVRKSALEKTPGFEWLRLEVVDDTALAQMLRASGARSGVAVSRDRITLTWYPSVSAMIRGLEKNLFAAAGHFSFVEASAKVIGLLLLPVLPLLPLACTCAQLPCWLSVGPAALLFSALTVAALVMHGHWRTPIVAGIAAPLGVWMIAWALARSTWMAWRRGGILWRGTLYPLEELRVGQRVKL